MSDNDKVVIYYTDYSNFESSNIDVAWYNANTGTLYIEFVSGYDIYKYEDIGPSMWGGFVNADSPGRYYHSNILGGAVRLDHDDLVFVHVEKEGPKATTLEAPLNKEFALEAVAESPVPSLRSGWAIHITIPLTSMNLLELGRELEEVDTGLGLTLGWDYVVNRIEPDWIDFRN